MAPTIKSKLKFKKSIISTAEHLISTSDLLDRLASLHEELSAVVQDSIDLTSLDQYRSDLISRKLLKHKDSGIRAFVSCCLSDILRLYAPDAPYTDTQLTDIFKLVLSQFEQLGDLENGYYVQQKYLIVRLLEYRSIVLITDLPTSGKLLEELFLIFYDDNKKFDPKMYNVIGGILGEVISEFDSVPMTVLKLIFNKFLTYNPDEVPKGLAIVSNCGYELSLILCQMYTNRMSRQLTRYYSEILYNVTNEKDNNTSTYDSNFKMTRTVEKLHKLVVRLWETVPELVAAIIGFIYHELSSENEIIRRMTTRLIGQLLTINSDVNFVVTHQDAFKTWLSKIADISSEVRIEWAQSIPAILSVRDDISEEIGKGLSKTFIDSDYRVRKYSILIFDKVAVAKIWKSIQETSIYTSLLQLTREKNREVRELCIKIVAKFYSKSIDQIERSLQNEEIWDIVDTIPSTLFKLYYINDLNINEQVDNMIFEYLLPLEIDNSKRVARLITVISHFDKKAYSSFFAFNKRQLQVTLAFSKYIEFSEFLNDNEKNKDRNLESSELDSDSSYNKLTDITVKYHKTVEWLSSDMAEPRKVTDSLEILRKMNDSRLFFLIKSCITPDVTMMTLKGSFKELFNKLQDPGLFRKYNMPTISTIMPKELAANIRVLLYRSAPIMYNVSNIPVFLDLSKNSNVEEIELKRRILDDISTVNPTLFKDQVRMLKDNIKELDGVDGTSDNDLLTISETLKTLYKISKVLKDQIDFDSFFLSKLHDFAIEGNPIIAKYATKLIALSHSPEEELSRIKSYILPLNKVNDKKFASHVAALMEIFKFYPKLLDENSTDIVSYLIKDVLLVNEVVGDLGDGVDWVDDSLITGENREKYLPLSTKIFALKLFTNKLRSISHDATTDDLARSFTEKTIKLFFYLIASGGELVAENNTENYPTPDSYQKKLRLTAGLQILKLAKISNMNEFIKSSDIIKLINLVEDESLEVRKKFLDRLDDFIGNELISIKFLPLVFFTAYEPNNELKKATKTWINYSFNKESFRKGTFFERVLPRLIHAIAHHPDIVDELNTQDSEDSYLNALTTAIDYLVFYFDSIAAQDNFNLLYYLSERVKNYQDKLSDDDKEEDEYDDGDDEVVQKKHSSEKMYIIGELSQMILLQLKERRNWQHSAYPGKLNLPNDLFKPFSSVSEAQASFRTYIDEKYSERLKANIKVKVGRIVHASQTQRQRAQKRLLANEYQENGNNSNNKKKRRTTKARRIEEDNEDEESEKENGGPDDTYVPAQKGHNKRNANVRKNLRIRKNIDYRDSDDDEDKDEGDEDF